jgi:hypothetical protein
MCLVDKKFEEKIFDNNFFNSDEFLIKFKGTIKNLGIIGSTH